MLTALLLLLLAIVALLAIPLTLTFNLTWPQRAHRELELGWAFGLVSARIPLDEGSVAPYEQRHPVKRPRRGKTNLLALIRQRPLHQRLLKFLRDCWRAIHKQELRLYLRIGLDDPADTGQLWAMMGPLAALLANSRNVSYELVPEFNEETFELQGSGRVELVPLRLLALTIAMLFSPTMWRGFRRLRVTSV